MSLQMNEKIIDFSQVDFTKNRPSADQLLAILVQLEKDAKRERKTYSFDRLLGTWRLTFITGTKKAQKQAGVALGKGRYLPKWLGISIAYTAEDNQNFGSDWQRGKVVNRVKFGLLNLEVSGSIKYQEQKRLLGFDFTHVNGKMGGLQVYDGDMRGGSAAVAKFHETSIAKQPFFSYFYVDQNVIAARGRGGGIALWTRLNVDS